ncbi:MULTISPECIES: LysR family transcriptional regulator [unclassified Paraburkholderia]|uniref:LysR family transcriptional regulator n=1 Tax=unclassified Paraburkholderia TaxID=2615204 RepID=UPI002AB111D5|nr:MULTISPECIES: LysR family transcriptional regulator [unclassified Paraburkholderia]
MHDIDTKTLRLFVAVCEHGNMGHAARESHIEPSAISKRIAQLETDLGVPLLTRSRRGVQPTQAGVALLEHARSVIFTLERAVSDIAAFGSGLRGSVSVCASASAIAEALLDDLASFMRMPAHENIRVNVDERTSKELVQLVRDGVASVGVCWDNVELGGLEARPWRTDRLALAVPGGHALARRKSVAFADTLGFEHVGLPPSTAVHTLLQRAAALGGRTVDYRATVSNFDAAFRVVAAKLGISVVPEEVGQSYTRIMNVRLVPLSDAWAQRRFIVCFRAFDALQPAAQRMVEHLVARAQAAEAA